jgi:hypothetical protein
MRLPRSSAVVTILLVGAILLGIALISGISYEQVHRAQDRERLPQIGRSVFIGARALNIDCSGAGSPAVILQSGAPWALLKNPRTIFESGGPRPGYSWAWIHRNVAQFTRTCWYDPAGAGWSDLGPYPRDSASQARDLHTVLSAMEISPPFVLVAESSAALDAHVYTGFYPSEVAGLVLVDGVHHDLFLKTRPGGDRMARLPGFVGHSQDLMAQLFHLTGFYRMGITENPPPAPPKGIAAAEWNIIWRLTRSSKARAALMQDIGAWPLSASEARAAGTLGSRPLRVIGAPGDPLQTDLAGLSTRGRQITVDSVPGDSIYQAADSVLEAIRQVVAEAAVLQRSAVSEPRP